ncbi:MAG: 5'/3'-nucleotidase SurE [Dehalococcoidales bacterium]|nr:5'/3'-nucleotidase SurE [Dehalococcoidales bacterium]
MYILLTNDDGIQSPGLIALAAAVSRVGEVLIVAPDKQQSGVGSCVSLHSDMNVAEVVFPVRGIKAYSVGGTPSDCVMLGLRRLSQGHVDLVVSGINLGPNVGRDIPYSGTVMATLQAHYRKIPSVAISQFFLTREEKHDFSATDKFITLLVKMIADKKTAFESIINVNVPNLPPDKIKGIKTTRAADTGYVSHSSHRHDGAVKYTLELDSDIKDHLVEGTDIWAIHHGYISVTPLQFNITDIQAMPLLQAGIENMGDW